MRQHKYEYDAFISHAVEDKIPIANELCAKLEQAGLKIWYSGKELGVGDSIEKTIEKGLNRSRYGIVIFSPTYLAKNWTIREFYTLLAKEIEEQKVILPVLYNISLDELKNKDLLMADRFAVNSDRGMDFVVERLIKEIRKPKAAAKAKVAWFSRIWLLLFVSLLVNVALILKGVFPIYESQSQPLQLQSSFDTHPSQLFTPAMFGEMQGFFQKMNGCTCNHTPHNNMENERMQRMKLVGNAQNSRVSSGLPSHQPPARSRLAGTGGRMTMAVVFQIETPSEREQPLEEEVNEMLQTISLSDIADPFITVSHRESGERRYQECLHARVD